MTSITKIPAGTTHILTNRKHEGDAEFIQQVAENTFKEWAKGISPAFSRWVYVPACLIDLDCYTPIDKVNSLKELEDAENEDAEFNRVGVNNV